MLKAYDLVDMKTDLNTKEKKLSNQEKYIAMRYAIEHPTRWKHSCCPVCGSESTRFIFERWEVDYCICEDCGTIYVPIDELDVLTNYINLPELKTFRGSEEYQSKEKDIRDESWNEFISWMSFRTFRYLGRNANLSVIDIGNKYLNFSNKIKASELCGKYELQNSLIQEKENKSEIKNADIILYLNQIKHTMDPVESLNKIRSKLKDNGLLLVSTRLGSGFDVLTLKGGTSSIFPYEHCMLPSRMGLEIILQKAGFEILEITTPGTQDVDIVFENHERIDDNNYFVRNLIKTADERVKVDFQQFLQKSCLSSFARVVARKVG